MDENQEYRVSENPQGPPVDEGPKAIYKSGGPAPKKRRGGLIAVIVILVLLLGGGVAAFFAFGGMDLFAPKEAPVAHYAEGDLQVLRLPAPEGDVSEESLRGYFREALDYAGANGYDTILFEAKSDLTVWWRDKHFPTAPAAAADDSFFRQKLDPLAILCEEAEGREIQLWLLVDPYSAEGVTEEMKGQAAKDARESGAATFSPGDEPYRQMLAESLARLPQNYPIAGIALTGFTVSAENPVDDIAAWQEGFSSLVSELQAGLAAYAPAPNLGVDFDEGSTLISPAFSAELLAGGVRYLLPSFGGAAADAEKLAAFGGKEDSLVIVARPESDNTALALFTAAQQPAYAGVQLGTWPKAQEQREELGFLASALVKVDAPLPAGFEIPHTLQVNYPASYDTIDTDQEQVYVMGNSDPAQPLLLNGEEVQRGGTEGTFGVLVPLAYGDNLLTFTQGGNVLEYTITRPEPPPVEPEEEPAEEEETTEEGEETEEEEVWTPPSDGTVEAQPGQAVQIVSVFAGGLTEPGNDAAINETYYKGAVGVVQASVQVLRWDSTRGYNVYSWDYLLTSGDYVSAQNCVWIEGDGQAAFTGLVAEGDERGRGEWIRFEGTGTPAAIISCENGRLDVLMHNTSFALSAPFTSELVTGAEVEPTEGGVILHLDTRNLWGYQIDYTDGVTKLFLKRAPVRSGDPAKPLAGVRVMLDPGHGADDAGAPGIMGGLGPNEREFNLAQAEAVQYRLLQLGAEVTMLRSDNDTFYTTQERLAMQMEEKPDFFLSVHHNSGVMTNDQSGTVGMQDFYYIPAGYSAPLSAQYAGNLMDSMATATGRPASAPAWGYFNVTRTAVCPSVLFEYAFMISPADFEDAASAVGLWAAGCGTADGILNMVPEAVSGTGEAAPADAASSEVIGPSSAVASGASAGADASTASSAAPPVPSSPSSAAAASSAPATAPVSAPAETASEPPESVILA